MLYTFIMVVHSYGDDPFGFILPDHVLIEITLDLVRFEQGVFLVTLWLLCRKFLFQYGLGLQNAVVADMTVEPCNQDPRLMFFPSAKRTAFLCFCHYWVSFFDLISTSSIMPYSLASSAVIQ